MISPVNNRPLGRPWLANYDPGVPATISYPEHTLHAILERSAATHPDHACTLLGSSTTTYAEMNQISDNLAAGLRSLGVQRGDRVGILLPNLPQFVMAFYGILKAGAVVVATNPLYTQDEIAHQLRDSGVQCLFVSASLYETMRPTKAETGVKTVIMVGAESKSSDQDAAIRGQSRSFHAAGGAADLPEAELDFEDLVSIGAESGPVSISVSPDDTALFQYSGGTTGISKAAVATHRSVVANTLQFRRWLVTLREPGEVMLMAIPLYHAYGMIAGMSLGISLGASLALVPNPRDLPALLEAIRRHQPTVFPGVPALYNAISNHPDVTARLVDLSSIRVCISGSTSLMRETKVRFEGLSGGKICEGYGLSEAPVVTHCNPLLGANKIGSIGMPMPDVECRIVDPDNGELDVDSARGGELILRGPQLMQGYHNMPAETAAALRTLSDGKTWLFTGDIVTMDSDGYFFIIDRKKELIKPGGFQVWPREVEEVLAAHEAVSEVGVAGVPDPERGEAVKAWVVLRAGSGVSAQELRAWCRARLAPYKVPTWIVFRTQLPRSNVGKVLRRELVREHREAVDPEL